MEFSINPKRVATVMLVIIAVLAVLHIAQLVVYFQVGDEDTFDFIKILDFDYEANLPSFYSSTAILFCAILLFVIGMHKRNEGVAFRYHWLGLAVIFTFLGLDEGIALHEGIGDFVEEQQWVDATGVLYFAWVVPYGILLVLFAAAYFRFLLSLPYRTMSLFLGAGFLFVGGAIGIEVISAAEADLHGTETIYYSVLYTLEELCEMVAIVIFAYALMRYIEDAVGNVRFHISSV